MKMIESYIPVKKQDSCSLCGLCAEVCPQAAIKIENNEFILDVEKCLARKMEFCSICVEHCRRQILVLEEYQK
ncbi:MAG: hypothetical protein EAX96_03395 [Candidatus Lokiarchaeota archaeon]|nr:hypothetical protein [Candidatus Lokiarchaeota archaeon]